jgi:Family of unknown function (DUF6263)
MTVRAAGLALAVLALSAVSAVGADVTLRWKFRKDKPYHYVLTQGTEMSMMLQNNNIKTKMSQISEITWVVNAVKSDGSAEMTQTIDRMQIKVEGPAGNIEVDSKQKADGGAAGPAAMLNKMIEGMVGAPMQVVMSARGEVTSVKVPDKVLESLKIAGAGGQAMGGAFSEKGMKQLVEQSSMLLPEKAVSPGTTWEQKRAVETAGLGTLAIDTTYTDKGEAPGKPGLRLIDGAVKIDIKPGDNAQLTVRVASQDNAATFFFNTKAGHLSRSEMKQTMKMEISAGGQMINQDLNQTVSMVLAGEPGVK